VHRAAPHTRARCISTAGRGSPPLTQSAPGRFDDDVSLVNTHGNFNYFMNGIINLFQVRSLLARGRGYWRVLCQLLVLQ
jgi:hypothetical protein